MSPVLVHTPASRQTTVFPPASFPDHTVTSPPAASDMSAANVNVHWGPSSWIDHPPRLAGWLPVLRIVIDSGLPSQSSATISNAAAGFGSGVGSGVDVGVGSGVVGAGVAVG